MNKFKLIMLFLLAAPSILHGAEGRFNPAFNTYASLGQIAGWETFAVTAMNSDVDSGTLPEDLNNFDETYAFATSSATLTIASDSANDTAAGSGCRSVSITGLDSAYDLVTEIVATNGTSNATTLNEFIRVNLAFCSSSGASETNEGKISIKHNGTIISGISTEKGRSRMGVFTVPDGFFWLIDISRYSINKKTAAVGVIELQIKPFALQTWQTILSLGLNSQGTSNTSISAPSGRAAIIQPKTDIRIRATHADANGVEFSATLAGFFVDTSLKGF